MFNSQQNIYKKQNTMKEINVLSLFDGMSCGQIALERAGIKVNNYYASEIDKYAMKVTQANYPNTIQLGSVTELINIDWSKQKVDLIIGGSPCQGFSTAGNELNFNDPRSKLFFEYVRMLNEIRKINPDVKFLLENVGMKKEFRDVISSYLGVEPIPINSAKISGQNRPRFYWTNIPNVEQPIDKMIKISDVLGIEGVKVGQPQPFPRNYKSLGLKRIERMEFRTDNKSNAIITNSSKNQIEEGNSYRKLTPLECERLQTVPDNYTNHVSSSQRYNMLGNGWTVDVIAHIFKNLIN